MALVINLGWISIFHMFKDLLTLAVFEKVNLCFLSHDIKEILPLKPLVVFSDKGTRLSLSCF